MWQHRGGQGTFGHEGYSFLNGFQNKPDVWNYRNSTVFLNHRFSFRKFLMNQLAVVYRDTRILDDGYDAYFSTPGTGPDGPGEPGLAGNRYFRPDHSLKFDDSLGWEVSTRMSLTAGLSLEYPV